MAAIRTSSEKMNTEQYEPAGHQCPRRELSGVESAVDFAPERVERRAN